jgi:DNA-binding Lrp family transcriptional regulator
MSRFKPVRNIDEIDLKVIDLMTLRKANKEISQALKIPLSTIQRRVRNLIEAGFVNFNAEINYEKFGFKTGLVHVYLKNGNIDETAKKIKELKHITSIEIHIGNSDVLGHVVYKGGKELLNLIASIKSMEAVDKVVWSERVYQSPPKVNSSILTLK